MKLPYSWLKELVPALPPVADLEPLLASLGLPLEGTEDVPAPPEGVLLVTVTQATPIEGTQLTRLELDTGANGPKTIASGAPNAVNLPAGTMLALVTPGTKLGDVEYGVRSLQGVESWGMAASAKELSLGESAAGLMLFPPHTAAPGTPMHTLWASDTVLDVEVTPNRADVLSVLGLARDVAAALNTPLVQPPAGPAAHGAGEIEVSLPTIGSVIPNDPTQKIRLGSDYFVARTVNGVQNGPSPLWLQRRLMLCGSRTVSAIVDVSNYVMFELGQPTALYDRRDVVNDRILVGRGLRTGETVTDLLGTTHTVTDQDVLILDGRETGVSNVADAFARTDAQPNEGVLGIAGIVGAKHGSVQPDTQDVVIEAAHFDAVLLRRTSTRLGLKTDAVYRYERGTDPTLPPRAADRIAGLLGELGGQIHPGATVAGTPTLPAALTLDADAARKLLGMQIETSEMAALLTRLGCTVTASGEHLNVTPPPWRVDMNVPEDLIEEVARLHGYANLPETLPTLRVHPDNAGAEASSRERRELKRAVAGLGFQEVVTYTFTSDEEAAQARSERPNVRLKNPLTADRTGLRTALYPSLLKTAASQPAGTEKVLLFEVGHIFPAPGETERLGLLMRGPLAQANHAQGVAGGYAAFRGLLEALAGTLGAALEIRQLRGSDVPAALHPGIAGELVWNGTSAGWLGAVHPEVAAAFGLKGDTYLLEAALPLPGRPWAFRDPSRAPAAWRDLAIIAPAQVGYGQMAALLRQEAGPLLETLEPFDIYSGAPIPEGQRSVAVRLIFRGEKTLSDAEVDPIMDRLMTAIRGQGWNIREK
ncbi:phenylalanine--tRNA ligase subunit beta [Deinococcus sp. KNUC1210]|uniref:phenylalanine--tRNA ligase subunit beta n=1 Tax=Deinococcus sp. KNUC1210 TaxID=2917691 RepID=UPI001EEFD156|nr:phenylalanine--tRNA ligase subunit beta [Deinococcus sp. KNUC1210]ULH14755.1 phenylalanine--tRNA ligase subunit beta [Deinococcus sp. KNUC1210]